MKKFNRALYAMIVNNGMDLKGVNFKHWSNEQVIFEYMGIEYEASVKDNVIKKLLKDAVVVEEPVVEEPVVEEVVVEEPVVEEVVVEEVVIPIEPVVIEEEPVVEVKTRKPRSTRLKTKK